MKHALLGFAAAAAATMAATPVPAQEMTAFAPGMSATDGGFAARSGDRWRGDRDRRRHGRARGAVAVPWDWDDGEWAKYNNRSWQADSYNDWWHDRPDRAFPRWVRNNDNCERMWWSGGGWRC